MSTTREVTVWCDAPDCFEWTYGTSPKGNATTVAARVGAKNEGWTHRHPNTDYCPKHSKGKS